MPKKMSDAELLSTLGDFTSRENWDKFFTLRGGVDHPFEWYVEWPTLRDPLLSVLSTINDSDPIQILVPGCGNSQISEFLYDASFRNVTNIDFSKVVVSDMLRRHVRERPEMKWRVMDMTDMQFSDGLFDVVLDKGGLDALMEPEHGSKLGSKYLSEVKRVLRKGGKYICLTLAESHVLELLFSKFRFGWKMDLHAMPHKPSDKPIFQTFMVVIAKESSIILNAIVSSFEHSALDCNGTQGRGLIQALEIENKLRSQYSSGADILYSFEDLQLGVKGDLKELIPGRRIQLTLGEQGESRFSYKSVLLDSHQQSTPFIYHCGVFLVPKTRAHEWLFSSVEGQWAVVESSKAARLIMVFLGEQHSHASMDDIQKDLSPLVKRLMPGKLDNGAQIPFMMANDGVKQRNIVQQITSTRTGPIVVEDVIYENGNGDESDLIPLKDPVFRRLTFERSLSLVQSEALLVRLECTEKSPREHERKKTISSKSRKRGSQRRSDPCTSSVAESRSSWKVDHDYLASSYHSGIISGFTLIAPYLEHLSSSGRTVKTVVIGLGAGLLPMFLRRCMPFSDIEVVELDPIVLSLAKDHFGFTEDEKLKVHIADGIHFVRAIASDVASSKPSADNQNGSNCSYEGTLSFPNGSSLNSVNGFKNSAILDILIIDADSADASSGLTCPPAYFTEESFLSCVKKSLNQEGLFVINLVSRSLAIREMVVSRMKRVNNTEDQYSKADRKTAMLFASHAKSARALSMGFCSLIRHALRSWPCKSQGVSVGPCVTLYGPLIIPFKYQGHSSRLCVILRPFIAPLNFPSSCIPYK